MERLAVCAQNMDKIHPGLENNSGARLAEGDAATTFRPNSCDPAQAVPLALKLSACGAGLGTAQCCEMTRFASSRAPKPE